MTTHQIIDILDTEKLTQIIEHDKYTATFNDGLVGYVITFKNGRIANTQWYIEDNRLHGGYGELYLERYTEYDDELTDEEINLVDEFVKTRNHSGEF